MPQSMCVAPMTAEPGTDYLACCAAGAGMCRAGTRMRVTNLVAVPGWLRGKYGTREISADRDRLDVRERPSWLPGDLRQADLVTKVHRALASNYLRRARPGPPRVEQARYAAPYMPVRELGGIRPPVWDFVVKARRPGQGFALHRSPLEDLGSAVRSAARAAEPQFNDILPAGGAGVNGQIAPRW